MTFEGVKNLDGLHPPLIDVETFEQVQEVLRGHAFSGDRSHKHEQYLKGSVPSDLLELLHSGSHALRASDPRSS